MTEQHRHYWIRDDDDVPGDRWACAECAETCEACFRCDRWTETSLLICPRCLTRVEHLLDDLDAALDLYEPQPRSIIPAIRYDRDRISGSFSDDHDPLKWTVHDIPGIILGWAQAWAEESGQECLIDALPYLKAHLIWAAHNRAESDWDQWLAEMQHALSVAKSAAGVLPKRMPAPCAYCGGIAVQDWADQRLKPYDDGLQDEVRCLKCKMMWRSPAQYLQLSKEHLRKLPLRQPETLVTIEGATMVWPDIPIKTWRTWADRGELPTEAGWDVRGVPQYRVGDLEPLAQRRLDTTRRGRRAG